MKRMLSFGYTGFFWCFVLLMIAPLGALGQQPLDRYPTFKPWQDEVFNLDNFGIHLRENANTVGYIVFYVGYAESLKRVKTRIAKSRNYLIRRYKIAPSRLVVISAGPTNTRSITVLHIRARDSPPPYSGSQSPRKNIQDAQNRPLRAEVLQWVF